MFCVKREAFLPTKDHKYDFKNKPSYRSLKPSKSDSGKVSKIMLQQKSYDLRKTVKVKGWRNTNDCIESFNNITNRNGCTFLE